MLWLKNKKINFLVRTLNGRSDVIYCIYTPAFQTLIVDENMMDLDQTAPK